MKQANIWCLFIALAFLNKLVDGFRLERRTALFLLIDDRQVQHRTVPLAMMNGFSCCAVFQRGNYLLDVLDIFIHRFGCQVRFFHFIHQGLNGDVVHLRQGQVADDGKNPLASGSLLRVERTSL